MKSTRFLLLSGVFLSQSLFAHGPVPLSLKGVPVPYVDGTLGNNPVKLHQPDISDPHDSGGDVNDGVEPIVVNKQMAIALGKALFWDVNVGSDGMACGSCHFHAGADTRVKNQLNPGMKNSAPSGSQFSDLQNIAGRGGPNYSLRKSDFPFHKLSNPFNPALNATPDFDTDDVASSSGTFSGKFTNTSKFTGANDNCDRSIAEIFPSPENDNGNIFDVNGIATRRVEPRNAPTVINAIFNYRNFWDGRANNIYNGSSSWGDRDPNAGVYVKTGARSVEKQKLRLNNASLASLAMGPPLSDTEMGCRQRKWEDIGRKLLLRQPLQSQKVHYQDSVFSGLGLVKSSSTNQLPGLSTTYKTMITKAFNPKFWALGGTSANFPAPPVGQAPYVQMEANFSMFFGLALQLYQATLISDDAPIDRVARSSETLLPDWNDPAIGLDPTTKSSLINGQNAYVNNHCATCHGGPLLSLAPVATYASLVTPTPGKTFGFNPLIPYGPDALGPGGGAEVGGITPHGNVVTRDQTMAPSSKYKFMDMGFANTGVGNPNTDPGLGGVDDFNNPLSFSEQYRQYLAGNSNGVKDSVVNLTKACDFIMPLYDGTKTTADPLFFTTTDNVQLDGSRPGETLRDQNCMISPLSGLENLPYIPTVVTAAGAMDQPKMDLATLGAFKIPGLRNVELTGPFMHNGSMATLDQVVEFYSRKGNFVNDFQEHFMESISLVGSTIPLGSNSTFAKRRADLIKFLKTFTDDRVRYERAPFDHPEIMVPNGHPGNEQSVTSGNSLNSSLATDDLMVLPAVGASGSNVPLQGFDTFMAP